MTDLDGNQAGDAAADAGRQAQKSAAMRKRICEGATAVIANAGYQRASIQQVVRWCDISPGALQHHFPTKLDLVAATAEHLLARSVRWFARAKGAVADGPEAFGDALRRSWREQFRTDDYAALLEILVAARTDEALRARIAPALDGWRRAMEREFASLHPHGADSRDIDAMVAISRAMMTGLLVHDALLGDEARIDATLDAFVRLVTRR